MTDKGYRTAGQFAINCKTNISGQGLFFFTPPLPSIFDDSARAEKRCKTPVKKTKPPNVYFFIPYFFCSKPEKKKKILAILRRNQIQNKQLCKWQLTHLLCVDHFVLLELLCRCGGPAGGRGGETVRLWFGGPGPGLLWTARGIRFDEVVFFRFLSPRVGAVVFESNNHSRQKNFFFSTFSTLLAQCTFVADVVLAASSIAGRTGGARGAVFVRRVAPPVSPERTSREIENRRIGETAGFNERFQPDRGRKVKHGL